MQVFIIYNFMFFVNFVVKSKGEEKHCFLDNE